jgi:23S rRNA (uracil1939-C5)-methyltransferase
MTYNAQLRAKAEILRETLQRTAKLTPPEIVTHASPPWNYRNRTRMRVRTQPAFAIGYNRFASHSLLPVRECPISSLLINRTLSALWKLGEAGKVPQAVVEVEFFANAEDSEILVEVTLAAGSSRRDLHGIIDFVQQLRAEIREVAGVVPFAQGATPSRVERVDATGPEKEALGGDSLRYRTRGAQYQVSAGSFFQTNRYLIDEVVALATEGHCGDFALDLYAGVGLFTLPLSQTFREVAAVEIAPFSFHDLHANSPSNAKGYRTTVDQFLGNIARMDRSLDFTIMESLLIDSPPGEIGDIFPGRDSRSHPRFDYLLVDPPRAGLEQRTAEMLGRLQAPHMTYVSCDPSTLARDLKVLAAAGYRLTALHLLDLFPQTFHIETVAQMSL